MASLKDIRNRIQSVANTQKITSAMKLVAAAKLRRAQESAEAARPYAERMHAVIGTLASRVDPEFSPLFRHTDDEDVKRTLVVLCTSDRGLCGGFNNILFRNTLQFLTEHEEELGHVYIAPIGRKGEAFVRRTDGIRRVHLEDWGEKDAEASIELAQEVVRGSSEAFVDGEFDRVYIAYNRFESALTQTPVVEQFLPLDPENIGADAEADPAQGVAADEGDEGQDGDMGPDFIYEPSREALLNALLPQFLDTTAYSALLESVASEFGARMTAMDNASSNANDLIDELTLKMNRARQAMITTELSEITAGSEALKG